MVSIKRFIKAGVLSSDRRFGKCIHWRCSYPTAKGTGPDDETTDQQKQQSNVQWCAFLATGTNIPCRENINCAIPQAARVMFQVVILCFDRCICFKHHVQGAGLLDFEHKHLLSKQVPKDLQITAPLEQPYTSIGTQKCDPFNLQIV